MISASLPSSYGTSEAQWVRMTCPEMPLPVSLWGCREPRNHTFTSPFLVLFPYLTSLPPGSLSETSNKVSARGLCPRLCVPEKLYVKDSITQVCVCLYLHVHWLNLVKRGGSGAMTKSPKVKTLVLCKGPLWLHMESRTRC